MEQLPKTLPRFFWHFIKQQPVAFTVFFLAPLVLIIEMTLIPYFLKLMIDAITQHDHSRATVFAELTPILIIAGFAWVVFIVVIRFQNHLQAYALPRFEANIRMSVLDYVINHSYLYFSNQLSGKLANKISDLPRALDMMRMFLCWNVIGVFAPTITTLIILAYISPMFAGIMVLWLVLHIAISFMWVSALNRNAKANADDRSQLTGTIVDILSNIVPVKLFARQRSEMQFILGQQQSEKRSNKKMILLMNYFRLNIDALITLMLGVMVYLLVIKWQQSDISTGDFVFVFNVMFGIVNQMWWFGTMLPDFFKQVGTAQQGLSVIREPHGVVDVDDAKALVVTNGEIAFHNVSFHYSEGKHIFNNKNVVIEGKQKVGLVGFSGSGKTSFANLILRFFDVESGCITIDGQDISKVTQHSLREQIAMIPQDTSLFHRSLLENIRYGNINASNKDVVRAAQLTHCDEFIASLPEGYETLVGERGIKLSGGQRQRIAIARAMLKDAPILILDEATSALDSITERLIQESLKTLMQDRTTIVIAHRLSTLSQMDRILVFDNGSIVEDGTHEQLIAQNQHYAKLWHMQSNGFI